MDIARAAVTKFAFPGVPNTRQLYPASDDIRKLNRADGAGVLEYVLITPRSGAAALTVFTCQGRLRALDSKGVRQWREEAEKWRVNVVLHNYPGYGEMEGALKSRESRLKSDCEELLDFLVGDESGIGGSEICLLGNSIGCGPTLWLASRNRWRVRKVVVVSPFTSIWALGPYWVLGQPKLLSGPGILSCFHTTQCDPFPVEELVQDIRDMRILILHGDRDDVVPPAHGRQVFEFLKQRQKDNVEATFVEVKGATHGDTRIVAHDAIFAFFKGQDAEFQRAVKELKIGKGPALMKEED